MLTRCLVLLCAAAPLVCVAPLGAWDDDVRDVSGSWEMRDDSGGRTAWTFQAKDDTIHVAEIDRGQTVAEFDCNTLGKDCKVKRNGRQATISMWYSGPALVELTTQGSTVVKRRFLPSAKGDSMQVEVIPVVPAGKTETMTLVRKDAEAAKKP